MPVIGGPEAPYTPGAACTARIASADQRRVSKIGRMGLSYNLRAGRRKRTHGNFIGQTPSNPLLEVRDDVMQRAIFGAIGLLVLLGAVQGCATAGGTDDRQSSVTVYGTVDAGVSTTRDR